MKKGISKIISDNEILIRFIFKSDFKNKNISSNKINFANFLQPYDGGVSLQRESFCNEKEAKQRAVKIESKTYVGFYVFRKSEFSKEIQKYLSSNPSFKANVFATPIGVNNQYIALPINSSSFNVENGNPSHADIIYINPSPNEEQTPKTAIRSFVKKLFKERHLIIDSKNKKVDFAICSIV